MKKILLVLAFLVGSIASAAATCTSPAVMHDFPGTSFNMSLATNAGDGNCASNVAIPTWAGGTLGAMANYGTSPGAVLVPGTNAFITNIPAVSQSGTWNVTNISGTISLPTGAATSANQSTEITSLATIATNTGAAIPAGTATIGTVGQLPYPVGAVPITASATGTTAATTATLAGTAGKTTYICGYSIRANATAATTVTDTITGVITATMSSVLWVAPAASGLGVDEQIFSPCIPASATNTGIAIVSGAPGTGGTVSSKGWGYQL